MLKLVTALVIFVSVMAQASIFPKSMDLVEIKGAQLYCSQKGGMYAINFTENRLWQSDVGANDGIELTNVTIKKFRCPNCFDIQGTIAGVLTVDLKVRGNISSATAVAVITDGKQTQTISGFNCTKENK